MSVAQQLSYKPDQVQLRLTSKPRKRLPRAERRRSRQLWRIAAICTVLGLATFVLYGSVTSYPFINYGDPAYVTENLHIRSGLNWQTVKWAAFTTYSSNWHPLTWLSHALDYQLYGLNAGGHHFTNLLIHVLNALLVFLLLWRATRELGASAMVAALFALHPLNVESVVWVAERKNLLSVFLLLLTTAAYGRYVRRPSGRRYGGVMILFALGLASNPTIGTLPFLLFVLDFWPLNRIQGWTTSNSELTGAQLPWRRLVLEKLPLLFLSLASAAIAIVALRGSNVTEQLGQLPLSWRLENAIHSYFMYLVNIFWPTSLALEYPHPLNSLTRAQIGLSLLALVAVSAFIWSKRSKAPYALTGWVWFLITLLPVIGIVQVGTQGMADRCVYLPAIGIFLIVVLGMKDFIQATIKYSNSSPRRESMRTQLVAAGAIVLLVALSLLTFRQVGYWRSSFDLWQHTLNTNQDNAVAYDFMAKSLPANSRLGAIDYYKKAAEIAPWDPESHAAVAASIHDQGKLQQAIEEYDIALRAHPDTNLQARIYADLGVIYRQLDNYTKAQESSRLAVAADSDEVELLIRKLSATLAQHPTAFGYWLLGLQLEGVNKIHEAQTAYDQALRLDSQFSPAMRSLALLYMRPGTANAIKQP